MKKIKYFLLFTILINSCVNKKDYSSVGSDALTLLMNKDTLELKNYFYRDTNFRGEIEEYIKLYSQEKFNIISIDTISVEEYKYLDVIYRIDTSIHKFEANYEYNNEGEIKFKYIWIQNLSKNCNEYLSKPYKPSRVALFFPEISWTSTGLVLNKLSIRIQSNYLGYDIEKLRFKLKLFVNQEMIVNRTVICNEKIFGGDFIDFKVKEISNIYVGKAFSSKNIRYEAVALESSPHPQSLDCEELMSIKKKATIKTDK